MARAELCVGEPPDRLRTGHEPQRLHARAGPVAATEPRIQVQLARRERGGERRQCTDLHRLELCASVAREGRAEYPAGGRERGARWLAERHAELSEAAPNVGGRGVGRSQRRWARCPQAAIERSGGRAKPRVPRREAATAATTSPGGASVSAARQPRLRCAPRGDRGCGARRCTVHRAPREATEVAVRAAATEVAMHRGDAPAPLAEASIRASRLSARRARPCRARRAVPPPPRSPSAGGTQA